MSYEKVAKAQSRIIIGKKQTLRAMRCDKVSEVYYAQDADEQLVQDVIRVAQKQHIPYIGVDSKIKLGNACGIEVGASTVAIKR